MPTKMPPTSEVEPVLFRCPKCGHDSITGGSSLSVHHDQAFDVFCPPIERHVRPGETVLLLPEQYDALAAGSLCVWRLTPDPEIPNGKEDL